MCLWVVSILFTSLVSSGVAHAWVSTTDADCITADGSSGTCTAPSQCPLSAQKGKPVLCRYSRGYTMRICCPQHSYTYQQRDDLYVNDEPLAFPSDFENTGHFTFRPTTPPYNPYAFNQNFNYRPVDSFDRPSFNGRPMVRPDYNERPIFGYETTSRPYRPEFNQRPLSGSGSFNGRPFSEASGSSFNSNPNNQQPPGINSYERPNFERPTYEQRPSGSGVNSYDTPSYNERPSVSSGSGINPYERPNTQERPSFESGQSFNTRPDYNNQRPRPERPATRPVYNERPNSGSGLVNTQSYNRPDIDERPDSSQRPYNGFSTNTQSSGGYDRPRPGASSQGDSWNRPTKKTTPKPTWSLENNDDDYSSTRKRISEQKCEEYSRPVSETINVLPLSIDSEAVPLKVQKCDFSAVKLIVGGEASELGEFPHMAAVGFRPSRRGELLWNCGGTLISERYVLTAAHCVNTTFGSPKVVRLGEYNLARDNDGAEPVDYVIDRVIVHPNYVKTKKYNDIALIRLSRVVQFNKWIRPACLPSSSKIRGEPIATGWGRTDFVGKQSDILMKVGLNIIDNQQCNTFYRNGTAGSSTFASGITDTMICAGVLEGGRDTCLGDSGGPLSVMKRDNPCIHSVIGITSFGKVCGARNSPGVYTKVHKFLSWIERTVWSS